MERVSFLDQRLQWIGLGDILRSNLLKVPPYQRSFAWGKAHLEDFWDDLDGTRKENSEYFLGPIVVASAKPSDQRMTIIDGQQRLATASIMISVMVENLIRIGDTDTASDIERYYIGEKELRKRTMAPKLILNEEDKRFFTSIVTRDSSVEPVVASHRKIKFANDYFKTKVEECAPKEQEKLREWVIDWVEYIRDRAIVMLAVIPNESDAFAIFEALNARGSRLAIADLLKNHLFSCARASLDEVKGLWSSAMGKISEANEEAITDFLRHYWNSKFQLARERELYRRFRAQISDEEEAVKFTGELDRAASDYSALLNEGHETWRELGQKAVDAVSTLFSFRLEQNRPLLLAAMRKLPEKELASLLPWLLAWSVRGLVVGGIGAGRYEVTYANAAMAISSEEALDVVKIFSKLEGIIPHDTEFEIAFRNFRPSSNRLAHYLLRALESGMEENDEPYLVPNPDHDTLTLEHILPRNPDKKEWPDFKTDDMIWEYLRRLGNLALVTRKKNLSLGNRPFSVKREVYLDAELKLTKDVGKEKEWKPPVIERRQEEMAKLAIKVWPRIPKI